MLRLAVAILMIFIQCFGSVGMTRVVCFRGDGSICCISSAWANSDCCEREVLVQEPQGCKCCRHTQNTCDERNDARSRTSDSIELGSREFGAVLEACDCQPVLVMANLEISKSPEKIILLHSLIFTYCEFVFGHGLPESTDWSILASNPSLRQCRSSVMRC